MTPVDMPKLTELIKFNDAAQLQDEIKDPTTKVNYTDKQYPYSLLHKAVEFDSVECVQTLFEHPNINVNVLGPNRLTPLFIAIQKNRLRSLQALLSHPGINVNIRKSDMMTPLHYAVSLGNVECVRLLLGHEKINITAEDESGQTPLDLAQLSTSPNRIKIIQLLNNSLTKSALTSINDQDADGNTELHRAILNNNINSAKQLLEVENINIHIKNNQKKSALDLIMENKKFCDDDDIQKIIDFSCFELDSNGKNKLEKAVKSGQVDELKSLLKNKFVNVNAADEHGFTALHFAARSGKKECVAELLKHPFIDANLQSDRGFTPLYLASYNTHLDCVRELLAFKDIDATLADYEGKTPFAVIGTVFPTRKEQVIALFKQHGITQ